jgi:hypothetical protein
MDWLALVNLLISTGVAESLAKVVASLVLSIIKQIEDNRVDENELSDAWEIIDGIAAGHPNWDEETKNRYAADAILQYIINRGRDRG